MIIVFFSVTAGDNSVGVPASPAPTKAPATPAAEASKKDAQKARTGPASRGGKYYQRGGARGGSGLKEGAGNPNQNGIEEPDSIPKKFEGRGRGRGGRGGPRGGRRPFDRHSATGKTDSDKKIHQGWGGDDGKTEFQAEAAASTDAAAESAAPANDWDAPPVDNWGTPAADAGATEGVEADKPEIRPRKEEEEDNTLTLDQYLAQQKEKDTVVPKLEARKPNEGASDDLWKDAVALQKGSEEDAYFVGRMKTAPKARAKKEEKVFLEIDARFDRPSRGGRGGRGGDRGDRGDRGGRGRGSRGGRGRADGSHIPSFNVDDEAAFPSLS
ncbi:hypothetical protein E1B28_001120 [Marasmius oreades]|uniref:Hyaluronan/mRNA-binding protein domain-containing protein n=1 Tax=Marasmius oreades TaxID=181124 RepID=A0A9P7V2X4_9AGAR|nr:uncharacterized protein E1B28_001120 [Marasmius oreades]KAG7099257.1 hypothetical protein E1B28_001120 [Marasmius oreades]